MHSSAIFSFSYPRPAWQALRPYLFAWRNGTRCLCHTHSPLGVLLVCKSQAGRNFPCFATDYNTKAQATASSAKTIVATCSRFSKAATQDARMGNRLQLLLSTPSLSIRRGAPASVRAEKQWKTLAIRAFPNANFDDPPSTPKRKAETRKIVDDRNPQYKVHASENFCGPFLHSSIVQHSTLVSVTHEEMAEDAFDSRILY